VRPPTHRWKWDSKLPHNVEECVRPGCKVQRRTSTGASQVRRYRVPGGEWVEKVPECKGTVTA
jgi:hypothetical protein